MQKLGLDFCEGLPAAHAITGCDTTSSFYKIGKRIVYNKLAVLVDAIGNGWTLRHNQTMEPTLYISESQLQ